MKTNSCVSILFVSFIVLLSKQIASEIICPLEEKPKCTSKTGTCPCDFVDILGRCYYFSKMRANWYEAQKLCNDKGAQLATINSKQESDAVRKYIHENLPTLASWWLGAQKQGKWIWVEDNQRPVTWTNWCSWANKAIPNYNCLAWTPNYRENCWSDFLCDEQLTVRTTGNNNVQDFNMKYICKI